MWKVNRLFQFSSMLFRNSVQAAYPAALSACNAPNAATTNNQATTNARAREKRTTNPTPILRHLNAHPPLDLLPDKHAQRLAEHHLKPRIMLHQPVPASMPIPRRGKKGDSRAIDANLDGASYDLGPRSPEDGPPGLDEDGGDGYAA
jgi:hypothetical protein